MSFIAKNKTITPRSVLSVFALTIDDAFDHSVNWETLFADFEVPIRYQIHKLVPLLEEFDFVLDDINYKIKDVIEFLKIDYAVPKEKSNIKMLSKKASVVKSSEFQKLNDRISELEELVKSLIV